VKIRGCTEGNGGHAAFASILWSAPASGVSFYDALQQVPVDVFCYLVGMIHGVHKRWGNGCM
jgi:hypothetical protein